MGREARGGRIVRVVMAIDTREKRQSVVGIQYLSGPSPTPNAAKDQEWRQEVGYGYSGILVAALVLRIIEILSTIITLRAITSAPVTLRAITSVEITSLSITSTIESS